jgi:hypothetical protein
MWGMRRTVADISIANGIELHPAAEDESRCRKYLLKAFFSKGEVY